MGGYKKGNREDPAPMEVGWLSQILTTIACSYLKAVLIVSPR